ncbi:MAG: alpha/beta hydrolase [Sedimentitalea sp.]
MTGGKARAHGEPIKGRAHIRILIALAGLVLVAACVAPSARLAAPPNLYLGGNNYSGHLVPEVLRTIEPQILYVTNRAPDDRQSYASERSSAMAFGFAKVRFGAQNWEDLVARTHVDQGGSQPTLKVQQLNEAVHFVDVPLPTVRRDGALIFVPEAQDEYNRTARAFQQAVSDEIARTGNGRVLIYVHGVANAFDDSVTTLANLWHYTGRRSVPIAFSWPAGNGGLLGYFRDREAGDFSVYHAKEFLRLLADIPEVEDIDIVAHSRGTDVMAKALRELVIFNRGRGLAPKTAMKTGTLIFAAADLDTGVVRQRLLAERFSEAFEQINIYINPDDAALRLSSILTDAPRIGAATSADLGLAEIERLKKAELVHFIRVESVSGRGHSYFRANPAVLSDIVLALRTRAFPGGTLRPLDLAEDGFWQLHPNYPLERLPLLTDLVLP